MSDYEDVKVTDLVINNISQEKYDELKTAGQLEATQIYLTPTEESGGAGLPDQTDNAGKFLTTDGTTASWSDKALVNLSNKETGIVIGTASTGNNGWVVALGYDASATQSSVAVGYLAKSNSVQGVAIGRNATVENGDRSIAIGYSAKTTAKEAYQIGHGTNSERGTLYVGMSADDGATWQNHKLLDKNGTIPAERMSSTTGTTGQVLTKTDEGMAWQDAGGSAGGLTEVTVGAGLEGNGTSDNPLAIDTTFLDTAILSNVMVNQAQQEAMNARTEAAQALTIAQMNEQALASKQDTLTAQQLTAVNSGITAALVQTYDNYATQIAGKQDKGDYVSASTEGTGGQLLSILLCSNEAEALELSGTHAGSLCFFPAVTE